MENLKIMRKICEDVKDSLDKKDEVREEILKKSRIIIRQSKNAIKNIQKGKKTDKIFSDIEKEIEKIKEYKIKYKDIYYSLLSDALQEFAEAKLLHSFIYNKPLKCEKELGHMYVLGMGDAIGEIRRIVQKELRKGKIEKAEKHLYIMEELLELLEEFHYPDAIFPIRHKQDVARMLVERTRTEVNDAISSRKLLYAIARLEKK